MKFVVRSGEQLCLSFLILFRCCSCHSFSNHIFFCEILCTWNTSKVEIRISFLDQVNIIFDVVADILYIFQFSNYKCLQTHTCNSSKIKIWNSFLDQVNICEITQNISCLILVKTKFRIRSQIQ